MREHLGFLRTSSVVVKVAAWIFLFLGALSLLSLFLKVDLGYPKPMVVYGAVLYVFFFFLFFLIAKIADLLIKIISVIGGSASGGNEIKKE